MLRFFQHLWAEVSSISPEERAKSVRIAAWVGLLLVLIVLGMASETARTNVASESPIWDAVLQTRLALVRLVLALPILIIGSVGAVSVYQLLENSKLGDRILAGSLERSIVMAALLASCIIGLLFGVLR